MVTDADPLVETLNTFSGQYRAALSAAMLRRLGLVPRAPDEDVDLVNAAFKALAEGGAPLRWEPFFFDWFGGLASEPRALAGPRASLYGGEAFADFRAKLKPYEMERPERLDAAYFAATDPEELLYDEIEQIWAAVSQRDDWAPFQVKIEAIRGAGAAYAINRL